MQNAKLIALVITASMLTACTEPGSRGVMNGGGMNKQDIGTVAGAIGGGVIGSTMGGGKGKIATTIAGTLLGGALGNSIGASLDRADLAAYHDASQRALETAQPGTALPWRNPESGNYGSITPSNYYQNSQGQYCREYTQRIVVGGKAKDGYGTACRQPDGSWQIIQ